ncbi:MAG TPA: phosphate ABC transporter substrate-binding protein [Dehalococcoidales bacterium]|nr:phosphate ABC transporter substrate-binding protein [Dehalococcoidales bacterium]
MQIWKNKKWLATLTAGIIILMVLVAGCGTTATTQPATGPANTNVTTPTVTSTPTPIPATTTAPTPTPTRTVSELSGTITTSGSTTVQPLSELLAHAFMTLHPKVKVVVQGGGSSVGVKAANDGIVDIGAISRELSATEPKLVTFLLARDGIAVIVHQNNPVRNLTKEQVKDIFSGKITNWKEVGGSDRNINVASREEGSGTRTAFEEMIMGKDATILKTAILQSSNGALLQVVKSDIAAISYVSFGYLDKAESAVAINGVAATPENAKNGTYPIVRPLYFVTKNQPAGLVKAFLDFCASDEAQKLVMAEGYISAK